MSLTSALGISSGGLANVAYGISVVSQNVANASTPQYALEVATQTSLSAGGQEFGVRSGTVVLANDPALQSQVAFQTAQNAAATTTSTALSTIEPVLGTPGAGTDLGSRLAALQTGFSTLQTDPADTTAQGSVVAAAAALARSINALSGAYGTARQTAQNGIVSGVSQLNTALASIGGLSRQIISLRAQGLSSADLENQRAQVENTVSTLVDTRFLNQPNGGLTLLTAGGVELPTDGTGIAATADTTNPGFYHPGGGIAGITLNGQDITAALTGGSIGANIALRDTTLPAYQAGLDEFAEGLSTRFAAQGLTLFTGPAGAVPVATGPLAQSGYVGYAADITVNPAVTAAPSLVRDGTQAVAGGPTGASAFTPNATGLPGFTTLITRVLSYALGTQAQDGVAQAPLAITGLGPAGTLSARLPAQASLAGVATALIAGQAADSAAATADAADSQGVQTALQAKLTATTGVSVDTELGKLVALQNAYGANAKLITAVQTLFGDVLAMIQ